MSKLSNKSRQTDSKCLIEKTKNIRDVRSRSVDGVFNENMAVIFYIISPKAEASKY